MKDHERPAEIFDGLGHPARIAIFKHLLAYGTATKDDLRAAAGAGPGIKDHIEKLVELGIIEKLGRQSGELAHQMLYQLNPKVCVERGGVRTIKADASLTISAHA